MLEIPSHYKNNKPRKEKKEQAILYKTLNQNLIAEGLYASISDLEIFPFSECTSGLWK